jgi:hypothetical protein
MTNMDLHLSSSSELLLRLANRHRADFYPLFVDERNHGTISAKGTALEPFLIL